MAKSIKRQLVVVFVGLIAMLLAVVFIVNSMFLRQYYVLHKKSEMIEMYQMIDSAVSSGSVAEKKQQEKIESKSVNANISMLVVRHDEYSLEPILFSIQVKDVLIEELFGYIIGQSRGKVLDQAQNYTFYRSEDPVNQDTFYLEMFGKLSDGALFLLRSPLDSIRDSAELANKFLAYVGIAALVFGACFVWFFSQKITNPILELAVLSKRMANLDFNARYTGSGNDEIGILGESFNTMSQKLEMTISELKKANNQLQKDIEQKEKIENMRTEFLGNVSHELKTPIALIQGYAEGLKEGISEDAESREFYCDVIIDESNKMNHMVKNLLTLNQLEFGSEQLDVERFDLIRLLRGVIASCEILIQQAEASVDFIAGEEVYVWSDEYKTEQVFRNYLTNALHHVDHEKRIEIRVIPREDIVRVTVFNSGTPIPEEDIGKIWDKFYKVDKAHTREYGGNGIGLSIVKAIMESFHQEYGVRNYDNGVEFWFELDAKE